MKHLLVFISCLLAAYPSFDPNGDLIPVLSRLNARRRKYFAWGVAFLLAIWQVMIDIGEDRDSAKREAEQDVRYAEQKMQDAGSGFARGAIGMVFEDCCGSEIQAENGARGIGRGRQRPSAECLKKYFSRGC